jgi:hypothetical protein
MNNTTAENQLIAKFMGYKLVKCNNGKAWESPFKKSAEDIFEIHGRLLRETGHHYRWHVSWDWLMPVIDKIVTLRPINKTHFAFYWNVSYFTTRNHRGYGNNIVIGEYMSIENITITIEIVYAAVVSFIKWYNKV